MDEYGSGARKLVIYCDIVVWGAALLWLFRAACLGGVMFKVIAFLPIALFFLLLPWLKDASNLKRINALPQITVAEAHIQVLDNDVVFWRAPETLVFRGADRGKDPIEDETLSSDWSEFPDKKAQLFEWKLGQAPKAFSVDGWPRVGIPKWGMYFCTAEGEATFDRRLANKSVLASKQSPNRQNSDRGILKSGWWSSPYYFDMRDGICRHVPGPQMQDHLWNITYSDRYILDFGVWDRRPHGKELTDDMHIIDTRNWKSVPILGIPRSGDEVEVVVSSYEDAFVIWNNIKEKNSTKQNINIWKVYGDGKSVKLSFENEYEVRSIVPYNGGYVLVIHGYSFDGENNVRA